MIRWRIWFISIFQRERQTHRLSRVTQAGVCISLKRIEHWSASLSVWRLPLHVAQPSACLSSVLAVRMVVLAQPPAVLSLVLCSGC